MLVRSSADDWKRNADTIVQWSSYASILYLRLAPGFRIILRGKDVEHHNLVDDMMLSDEITYRPQPIGDDTSKDPNNIIDIQGFNVYHKNRRNQPFWRVWNAAGSDGRGVIGVLEANFVEPAHDKQGFERTIVLARLEARLLVMQKKYWSENCHLIGYAKRRNARTVCLLRKKQTPLLKASPVPDLPPMSIQPVMTNLNRNRLEENTRWDKSNLRYKQQTRVYGEKLSKHREDSVSNLREDNHSTMNRSVKYSIVTIDHTLCLQKLWTVLPHVDHIWLLPAVYNRLCVICNYEKDRNKNLSQDASATNEELLNKLKLLEDRIAFKNIKRER
ncbi:hypothetical protein HAX54_011949 [Datura stramonium]|uniref:Morc S5 domain-containing protein n=1 Tax=Datura stramonium TaxID=4076 RepID=A0ABS8TLT4_DATST|nr:hypothetical protein [Datura stramonium]